MTWGHSQVFLSLSKEKEGFGLVNKDIHTLVLVLVYDFFKGIDCRRQSDTPIKFRI
jgi:hypothetical protein